MKKIILLIVFLFCSSFAANAVPSISVPDTTIPRGEIYSIPVYADFSDLSDSLTVNSVEFVFQFDQYVIDLKNAELQSSDFFPADVSPTVATTYNYTPGSYRITFSNISLEKISGTLFTFRMEGLVAPRDTTLFTCTEVIINGSNVDFETQSALFNVPGDLISREYPTGLFINYPNPFSGSTIFNFNLHRNTKIDFKIFNYYGRLMYSLSDLASIGNIMYLSGEGGQKQMTNLDEEFPAGKYYFQFSPDPALFSSGLYFLTMSADDKFFSQPFVYCK